MRIATFTLTALLSLGANAQNIERIKITDNELGCRQIHDELGAMDKVIADAKQSQSSADTTTTAGQAGGVAAEVASRTGLFGQVGGLFGHIAGTVAAKTAANVAEQTGRQGVQQGVERERQALARKEHLTLVFLGKGCKASDPDAPATKTNAALPPASSGRSNLRAGAEADVVPKLGIGGRSELRVVTGKDAKIFFTGEMGTLIVKSPLFIEGPFGEVRTVEAFDTAGLANSLTAATGLQGAQHFVEKRELRVDRRKFAAGVLKAGATFNQFVIATAK